MDRVAERVLDLLRRNHVWLDRPVQQNPNALARDAELPRAIEQPLGVADRWDVGVGHEKHLVGREQPRARHRVDHAARVDDDVLVLFGEQPQQLLDGAAVCRPGAIEVLGPRQDFKPRFVLHRQLAQEVAIEPMEVVDGVD